MDCLLQSHLGSIYNGSSCGGFGSALEFGRGPGSLFIPSTVQCHLTESETLSVGFSKELQFVDYVDREMPQP